jgi:hypothetical protein
MEKRLEKLSIQEIQLICKKMDIDCKNHKQNLIHKLLKPLTDVYHNVIVEIQEDTWNLFVRDINAKKYFVRNDLSSHQKKVYDKLYNFLKRYKVTNANRINLQDGAKKTLIFTGVPVVFKIYKSNSVYQTEKKAYSDIKKLNLDKYFVKQYDFDDDSWTALADKLDSNRPKYLNSREKITSALQSKGVKMTDLNRGDNIGHYNGKDVIFDVKSLKI